MRTSVVGYISSGHTVAYIIHLWLLLKMTTKQTSPKVSSKANFLATTSPFSS